MTEALSLCRYGRDQLEDIRPVLLEVYAEVYADQLDEPFQTVDRFAQRLDGHVTGVRWEAIVGFVDAEPVGYAYAAGRFAGSDWATRLTPRPTDPEFLAEPAGRTLALFELMVRKPWRGTGAAHRIHEELLDGRTEQRVNLAVDAAHPRVRAMYQSWGYRYVGSTRPFPDAPLLDLMVRDLR